MTRKKSVSGKRRNPVPVDPIASLRGILKGIGPTGQDLVDERAEDLRLEREREERLLKQIDDSIKRRTSDG